MTKKTKRVLLFLAFFLFMAAVVIATAIQEFTNKPAEKLRFAFGAENYALIAAGFLCMLFTLAAETIKYVLMMKKLGGKVSLWAAFETAVLGKCFDNITPSGIGGQPFQIYNIHKHGYSAGISAAMPLLAFLTMQSGFVALAILVFIFKGNAVSGLAIRIPAYIGAVTYSLLPVAIVLFTISEKAASFLLDKLILFGAKIRIVKKPEKLKKNLLKTLEDYRNGILMISKNKLTFALLFVLSFAFQVATCSIPYFVLHAYNGTTSFVNMLAMTVFVYCSITIIPTPGNSGAAEGAFYLVFSQLEPTGLFWSMLIWRVICYYSYILIGLLIYGVGKIRLRIKGEKEEATHHENV